MFDRRQALRRLGAGAAIATGASAVLSSRDVAYAASCFVDTGSVPSGNLNGVLAVSVTASGQMRFDIGDSASCTCGGVASTAYQWGPIVFLGAPTGPVRSVTFTTEGNPARTAIVQGRKNNGSAVDFHGGERFTLDVSITWECTPDVISRTFRIDATATSTVNSSSQIS